MREIRDSLPEAATTMGSPLRMHPEATVPERAPEVQVRAVDPLHRKAKGLIEQSRLRVEFLQELQQRRGLRTSSAFPILP